MKLELVLSSLQSFLVLTFRKEGCSVEFLRDLVLPDPIGVVGVGWVFGVPGHPVIQPTRV